MKFYLIEIYSIYLRVHSFLCYVLVFLARYRSVMELSSFPDYGNKVNDIYVHRQWYVYKINFQNWPDIDSLRVPNK